MNLFIPLDNILVVPPAEPLSNFNNSPKRTIRTQVELLSIQITSIEHALFMMKENLTRIKEQIQ